MGTRPAPSYANIFMAKKIYGKIEDHAAQFGDGINPIRFLKCFLDDIFMVYTGSVQNLHLFIDEMNALHPTIKFTMNHTVLPPSPNTEHPAPHLLGSVTPHNPSHFWILPVLSRMD